MPNHVANILKFEGSQEDVKVLRLAIASEKQLEDGSADEKVIDFNKIIPMPSSMNITSGTTVDFMLGVLMFTEKGDDSNLRAVMQYPWAKAEGLNTPEKLAKYLTEKHSGYIEEARIALSNIEKYGCKDWYEWSTQNWGTKWNAYGCNEVDDVTITFDTAWSSPLPVIKELSKMFPEVKIKLSYADEDFGYNCGEITFLNGAEVNINIPEGGTIEAFKIAAEIQCDPSDCGEFIIRACESEDDDYIQAMLEIALENSSPTDVMEAVDSLEYFSFEFLEALKEKFIELEAYEFIASIDEKMEKVNSED